VIGSISAAALSFIVHEPSGIMLRSNAMSLSDSERRYRIISVSVRYRVNAGWVRNSDERVCTAGPRQCCPPRVAPNASRTCSTCWAVVASSHDTET
jgi:hypothetical protein